LPPQFGHRQAFGGLQKLQIAIGKLANYVQQALVKTCETRFFDVRRDLSEKGMGDPASDTSDGALSPPIDTAFRTASSEISAIKRTT